MFFGLPANSKLVSEPYALAGWIRNENVDPFRFSNGHGCIIAVECELRENGILASQ